MERMAVSSSHSDNQPFTPLDEYNIGEILENKKLLMKNSNMLQLVNCYFKKSKCTIDFITALVPSLMEARNFVELAIKNSDAANENNRDEFIQYFSVNRTSEFEWVCQELLSMLRELQTQKVEQVIKLKSVKIWRHFSCIIYVSIIAAFIISAIVVALKASHLAAALMAVVSLIPLISMGKWFDSRLKKYQHTLKAGIKLISIMLDWTYTVGTHLDCIRISLKQMEDNRLSLLDYVQSVFKDEDAARLGTEEMREKMGEFMKSIVDLMQKADLYSNDIWRARTVVLEEIIQLPA